MNMSTVSVDRTAKRHYGDDAGRYFSVSQVLDVVHGKEHWGSQEAMDRGTDLHRIFALLVASHAGLCDVPEYPAEYEGYVASMRQWITIARPEPIEIEQCAVSTIKGLPFAGTPDLIAWIHDRGKRYRTLVDLKSGQLKSWHKIQVQAYGKLRTEVERLAILYINENGSMPTWKIVKPDARDWAAFQAAVSLLQYRETL